MKISYESLCSLPSVNHSMYLWSVSNSRKASYDESATYSKQYFRVVLGYFFRGQLKSAKSLPLVNLGLLQTSQQVTKLNKKSRLRPDYSWTQHSGRGPKIGHIGFAVASASLLLAILKPSHARRIFNS